ncbi:MAG: hypothetical protein R3B37_15820 [Nitrospira sp.]|nr:hypothetical protein [Nitrospira sp.]
MLALFFLFLGILFLLIAAGRIWIDATPVDSPTIDSTAANNGSESVARDHLSKGNDPTS